MFCVWVGQKAGQDSGGVGVKSRQDHPAWGFARVCVICVTLLVLQLTTATSFDLAVDGEAGTLVGVTLTATILEWIRNR